jgi:hypothetical protein
LTKASDHPVLKTLSWRISVLIQTERRTDRRCPHLDRRIIRCYCLCCSSSATRPALLENGPSVHPTVPRVSTSVPTRPTIAPTLTILVPSVHPTMSFSFFFFASSTCIFLLLNILNMPLLIGNYFKVNLSNSGILKGSIFSKCQHSTNMVTLCQSVLANLKPLACPFLLLCMSLPKIHEVSQGSPSSSFFSRPNRWF